MQIKINFDTGYQLGILLHPTDFVARWSCLLAAELDRNSLLQEHSYSSFFTEQQARHRLLTAITEVNNFLKRQFIPIPCKSDFDNPAWYNQLHEQFEKLAGPDWDRPTRLMVVAPKAVKEAVKSINRWCHTLETRPYKKKHYMRIEFDTCHRQLLTEQDFDLFRPIVDRNVAVIDYSTLGKSLVECWQDGLPPSYQAMKVQKHYAANFVLHHIPPELNFAKFEEWCKNHDIDPIPKSEQGAIEIGTILDPNWYTAVEKTCKIQSITLE